MKFQDWFDPANTRHMEIYGTYFEKYVWPECEEINNLEQTDRVHWYLIAYAKMSAYWFSLMSNYEKFTEETQKELKIYFKII